MRRLFYLLAAGALLVPAAAHPVFAQQATQELTVNFLQGEPDNKQAVEIRCNIHPWMNGYAWVLDHPYATISKAQDPKTGDLLDEGKEDYGPTN